MSQTLQKMLLSHRGYRTESFSGSGVRDLQAVLRYEFSALRNNDILVYCNEHYLAGFNISYSADFLKTLRENADDYAEQVEQFVRRRLSTKRPLYALWLTTKDNVYRIYGGVDGEISCYQIPERPFVLSDLGPDGTLFVFQRHPTIYLQGNKLKKHTGVTFLSLWHKWFKLFWK